MGIPRKLSLDPATEERLAEALRGLPFVQAAWVFGSRATGRARPDSDLDLAALVQGMSDFEALRGILAACGAVFPSDKLDVVLLHRAPPLLRHRILRDGRLLVERDPAGRVRFQVQSLREYFDLEPARELFYQARRRALKEGGWTGGRSGDLVAQARRLAGVLRRPGPVPRGGPG